MPSRVLSYRAHCLQEKFMCCKVEKKSSRATRFLICLALLRTTTVHSRSPLADQDVMKQREARNITDAVLKTLRDEQPFGQRIEQYSKVFNHSLQVQYGECITYLDRKAYNTPPNEVRSLLRSFSFTCFLADEHE